MSPEKMITMANQIATFFATHPGEDQAQRVADHLNDFWEPRMRAQLAAHLETGGEGLDPLVVQAASLLRVPSDG
jgi:formate dehydrogenase subunit delta